MNMNTSGPISVWTGEVSVDRTDDISVLYIHSSLSSKDGTISQAKRAGSIKTNLAFSIYFNTLNRHYGPFTVTWEIFQMKQVEKQEAKQHTQSQN